MNKTADELGLTVHVEASRDVPADLVAYARKKVAAVGRYTSEPILFTRVTLSYAGDPSVERRALARVNMDWNGRPIRAHAASETMREAIDSLQERLRDRLVHGARNWEALRDRRAAPVAPAWRHRSPTTERPDWFPRLAEEREIIMHRGNEFGRATPDEAALEIEMLDYAFVLFRETATGQDSVLYKMPDGFGLFQLAPDSAKLPNSLVPLTVSPIPAPILTVAEAVNHLDLAGLRFFFFNDVNTGRGAVIYHRYDGHLGLIKSGEGQPDIARNFRHRHDARDQRPWLAW